MPASSSAAAAKAHEHPRLDPARRCVRLDDLRERAHVRDRDLRIGPRDDVADRGQQDRGRDRRPGRPGPSGETRAGRRRASAGRAGRPAARSRARGPARARRRRRRRSSRSSKAKLEAPAEGFSPGEVLLRERLADDGDAGRGRACPIRRRRRPARSGIRRAGKKPGVANRRLATRGSPGPAGAPAGADRPDAAPHRHRQEADVARVDDARERAIRLR